MAFGFRRLIGFGLSRFGGGPVSIAPLPRSPRQPTARGGLCLYSSMIRPALLALTLALLSSLALADIARNRAVELTAAGDEAGYAAFTRIAAAVKELGQLKPGPGERRH